MKKMSGSAYVKMTMAMGVLAVVIPAAFAQGSSDSSVSDDAARQASGFNAVWEINLDESEDPREKLREAMGGPSGRLGPLDRRGGRPGGGWGGPRPSGGRPRGGMKRRGGPARPPGLEGLLPLGTTLETSVSHGEFHVRDSDRVRIYYLDGEKHARETTGGLRLQTVAEMQGNRITIEEESERGMKITQTFELGPEGQKLVVTHRLENERFQEPVDILSVYDLLPEREAP